MKLLTKEIEAKLPKLGATEHIPVKEKVIVCKFFTPDSDWTWYAVEGQREDGDFVFFGLVHGFEKEWGYFSLSELESATGPMGLHVERDMYWTPVKVKDLEKCDAPDVVGQKKKISVYVYRMMPSGEISWTPMGKGVRAVFVNPDGKTGNLLDGRPVKLIDGKWVCHVEGRESPDRGLTKKVSKQDIGNFLSTVKARFEGLNHINGGYALVKKMTVKKVGPDTYSVSGVFIYGIQDTGDGFSEKYTERFEDIRVRVNPGGSLEVVRKHEADFLPEEEDEETPIPETQMDTALTRGASKHKKRGDLIAPAAVGVLAGIGLLMKMEAKRLRLEAEEVPNHLNDE